MSVKTENKPVTFDVALTRYKSNVKNAMHYARMCATLALAHFEAHGDTIYCQRFYEAMPQNYERKTAFILWLIKYSPAKLEGGKIVKDKSETANPFDLANAGTIAFWDFAPEKVVNNMTAADLIKGVAQLVNRAEKAGVADPAAAELLAKIKSFSATLGAPSNVVTTADSVGDKVDAKIEAAVKTDLKTPLNPAMKVAA